MLTYWPGKGQTQWNPDMGQFWPGRSVEQNSNEKDKLRSCIHSHKHWHTKQFGCWVRNVIIIQAGAIWLPFSFYGPTFTKRHGIWLKWLINVHCKITIVLWHFRNLDLHGLRLNHPAISNPFSFQKKIKSSGASARVLYASVNITFPGTYKVLINITYS